MFICPVCGYDELEEQAYSSTGGGSFEICPCCGYEFGYDDQYLSHEEYRLNWIKDGAVWFSEEKKPQKWSLQKQLENLCEN